MRAQNQTRQDLGGDRGGRAACSRYQPRLSKKVKSPTSRRTIAIIALSLIIVYGFYLTFVQPQSENLTTQQGSLGQFSVADDPDNDDPHAPMLFPYATSPPEVPSETVTGGQRSAPELVIEQDELWSTDQTFNTSVRVKEGVTLTIAPGVTIQFNKVGDNETGLRVYGTLLARGTESAPITFINDQTNNNYWLGLEFIKSNSVLENCTISFARYGLWATNATLTIADTEIANCDGTDGEQGTAIISDIGSKLIVTRSTITRNVQGILCRGSSVHLEASSIIDHSSGYGLHAIGYVDVSIDQCNISANSIGIRLEGSTSVAMISDSIINDNIDTGINASAAFNGNGNTIVGNGGWGVKVIGANYTLTNTTFRLLERTNDHGDLIVQQTLSVVAIDAKTGAEIEDAEVSVVNPVLGAVRGTSGSQFLVTVLNITTVYNESTGLWEEHKLDFSYIVVATADDMVNWTEVTPTQDLTLQLTLSAPKSAPTGISLKFLIGLIALILFFAVIILSLLGVIPQDRLPIQPALVVMTFVIVGLVYIGHLGDSAIELVGPIDLEGMVIIHPITALAAGFMVAGALEAAGAFEAAADALNRLEKFKWLGITGTVTILINLPTIIAMPCGRILGAALMPAALYFGYRVARNLDDPRMVGVVVFAFIVNAAASCGPSPLGGIGTIGEGMTRLPIGSFSDAQQAGIMFATGVCALVMKFITPMLPADLREERELQREEEEEAALGTTPPQTPPQAPAPAPTPETPPAEPKKSAVEEAVAKALAADPKATLKEVAAVTGKSVEEIKSPYVALKRDILKGSKPKEPAPSDTEPASDPEAALRAKLKQLIQENPKLTLNEAVEATGKDKKEISKIYVEEKKKSMGKAPPEPPSQAEKAEGEDPDTVLRGELARLLRENPKLTLKEAAEAVGKDKKEIGKLYVEEKKKSMGKA